MTKIFYSFLIKEWRSFFKEEVSKHDYESHALALAKAASIVKESIFMYTHWPGP